MVTTLSASEQAIDTFRRRNRMAAELNFFAAIPNYFFNADRTVGGTFLIRHGVAEFHDIPQSELGNVALNDFAGRMTSTAKWASNHGFVGGFPTFENADHQDGQGTVCGAILLPGGTAEFRDVRREELNNPPIDDIEQRFRETAVYATNHGFVGGYPNMFHADKGNGVFVFGTMLLPGTTAEFRDLPL
jgi:hypothetical protein